MLHFHTPGDWSASPKPPGGDALSPALLAEPVLIVEDEAMIAWTVESMLEEMGFTRIAIAPSGEAAIAQANRVAPRLIVSDINLGPGRMDGVQAAAAMLAHAAAGIVFVTGYAGGDTRGRIDREVPGAVVLAKPVGPDALRMAIEAATKAGH